MRKILTAAALIGSLIGTMPAFAEGNDITGASAFQAYTQPAGASPRADTSETRYRILGGDDQYTLNARSAFPAWTQSDNRVMLANSGTPTLGNFLLSSQSE